MIVSQFRVQNWTSTQGPPVAPPRIWGLYLTNLGDKPYSFNLTFHSTSADRLDKAFRLGYGQWGVDLSSHPNNTYRPNYLFDVSALGTAEVRLVPRSGAPNADVAGHVELSIPTVAEITNYYYNIVEQKEQGDKPVPVLVHAFETSSPKDSGREITLASGKALNEVTPDQDQYDFASPPAVPETPAPQDEASAPSSEVRQRDVAELLESPSGQTAISLFLGAAARSTESLTAINEQLKRSGHPLRLARARRQPVRK